MAARMVYAGMCAAAWWERSERSRSNSLRFSIWPTVTMLAYSLVRVLTRAGVVWCRGARGSGSAVCPGFETKRDCARMWWMRRKDPGGCDYPEGVVEMMAFRAMRMRVRWRSLEVYDGVEALLYSLEVWWCAVFERG